MRYGLKNVGHLLVLAACAAFVGCATSKKQGTVTTPQAQAPKPVKLVELPSYGPEKTGYDTSAGCLVLGKIDGDDSPIIQQVRQSIALALEQRGYPVADFGGIDTVEDRARVEKIVSFQYCSTRSCSLPTKRMIATDIYLVVGVTDIPDAFSDTTETRRSFAVWARDIADQLDPRFSSPTTEAAIDKAVDNLFCLDTFRRALGPGKGKEVVAAP